MFIENRIGGVMISVLVSSVVDRGFKPWSGQNKDYKIGSWCFSAKHAALRGKSKDLLALFEGWYIANLLYRVNENSEWLLFNAKLCYSSAISWLEQFNFQWNDVEVHFVLDQHAELDFYSANSLKQQSADRHVAPLGHIIPIPSQQVFALSP
jgi:hypothetical protein